MTPLSVVRFASRQNFQSNKLSFTSPCFLRTELFRYTPTTTLTTQHHTEDDYGTKRNHHEEESHFRQLHSTKFVAFLPIIVNQS